MFEQGPWRRQKKFFAADHLCSLTRLTSCSAQCLPRFSHAIYYFSLFWSSSSPTHQFVARLFFQIIYIGRSFAKRSVYVLSLTPCGSEYFKIFQQFCLQHVSQEPQVIFDSETNIYRVFSTSSYYHSILCTNFSMCARTNSIRSCIVYTISCTAQIFQLTMNSGLRGGKYYI